MLKSIFYTAAAGGLGATLYAIKFFSNWTARADFDIRYWRWYFFWPIAGPPLGVVSYFLIIGGLIALGAEVPTDKVRAVAVYTAVAFVAGSHTEHFIKALTGLAEKLWGDVKDPGENAKEGEH